MEKQKLRQALYGLAVFTAGALIFAVEAQTMGSFGGRTPSVTAPFPVTLVFPMFSGLGDKALYIWPIFFIVWAFHLFRGDPAIPKRTVALFGLVLLLSLVWFGISLGYGLRYQGRTHVITTFGLSMTIAASIGAIIMRGRTSPSFTFSLICHWLLVAWIVSFAFPYLGELM